MSNELQILNKEFPTIPIINASVCGINNTNTIFAKDSLIFNYPNPFTSQTKIEFKTNGGHTLLQLLDGGGTIMKVLVEATYNFAGMNSFNLYGSDLIPGVYYLRLQNEDKIFGSY